MRLTGIILTTAFVLGSCDKSGTVTENTVRSAATAEELTVSGTYESFLVQKEGFNCICSQGGRITTAEGEKILVCLESAQEEVKCGSMEVKGVKSSRVAPTSEVCEAGTYEFVLVHTYKCL